MIRKLSHLFPVLMLVVSTFLWGFSFPVFKALGLHLENVFGVTTAQRPSLSVFFSSFGLALRFFMAMGLLVCLRGFSVFSLKREEWKQAILLGLACAAASAFQMDGLQYTHASTSAFLTQGYCIFIPLFHALFRRQLPRWNVFLATALVLWGVAKLSQFDGSRFSLGRGEVETLLASFFYAVQILLLEKKSYSSNRVDRVSAAMFLVTALACLLASVLSTSDFHDYKLMLSTHQSLVTLLLLGVFPTFVAYLLMNIYQPRVSSTEAGIIYCTEPLFASLLALVLPAFLSLYYQVAYLNETLTDSLLWGGGAIFAANLLVVLIPEKKIKLEQM